MCVGGVIIGVIGVFEGVSYCVWWMCRLVEKGGVRGQDLSQRSGC